MVNKVRRNADPTIIAALLAGASLDDAAKRAGMSEQTVRRRLRDPEFRARLDAAETEMIETAGRALSGYVPEAVSTLGGLLHDGSSTIQLSASKSIIEIGSKRARHALEERVAALERAAAEREKDR
jgi:hypothetical protein